MTTTTGIFSAARPVAAAGPLLPQPKSPAPTVTPRLPFRVLQTSHAPAQLSLFMRPGLGLR